VTQGEGRGRTAQPRGRPSTVALYAPQVTLWLREDPDLSGAEILRRVRLAGYRDGKSALYELVRRLRVGRPAEVTVAVETGPGPVQGITNR
jgi:hypothetical protein